MGVDTHGIIRKGVTIDEIKDAIEKKYTDTKIHASSEDFFFITFTDGEDNRRLAVSYVEGSCLRDYGIDGVWLSLGYWGGSVRIIQYLCETFGGYIDENDCDDEEYYPINLKLYESGSELTSLDLFRNKVISVLGFENLKKTMELFEEYKEL